MIDYGQLKRMANFTNVPRSFRDGGARERGNAQGGRVEATLNFREISRGPRDVRVVKFNLKYKNHKIINSMQNPIAWWS